jgi:hypothetical protein
MGYFDREIKNAVITEASITINGKGILDCWLTLDYGGSGQGFGGYALQLPKDWAHYSMLGPAGHFIYRVMEIAGVNDFDELTGKSIRVDSDNSKVYRIGHIVNDDWFDPKADFELMKELESEDA